MARGSGDEEKEKYDQFGSAGQFYNGGLTRLMVLAQYQIMVFYWW